MNLSEDELMRWRQLILTTDDVTSFREMERLNSDNHAHFLNLAHHLMRDAHPEIKTAILSALGELGDRNDSDAESVALSTVDDPKFREVGFLALATVATPALFPTLLTYAETEYPLALRAAAWQATTPEQIQQVLSLARRQLLSTNPAVRTMAVRVINGLSDPAEEETILLEAARRYFDEQVFDALGHATPRALPILQEMLADVGPGFAESKYIARAITTLQGKKATS